MPHRKRDIERERKVGGFVWGLTIAKHISDGRTRTTIDPLDDADRVETGLGEKRTGIICIGAHSAKSGRIIWEKREPDAAETLRRLTEEHSQQDPTTIAYTRLTAKAAVTALKEKGFADEQLPSLSSMANVLNRMGYHLRNILKSKPLKKT